MKPKVYMSIPISGRDIGQVKRELLEVSKAIAAKGWEPVSPLDGVEDYSLPWAEYILRDLQVLRKCDGMIKIELPDGSYSDGFMVEHYFARGCKIPIGIYNIADHKFYFIEHFETELIYELKNKKQTEK